MLTSVRPKSPPNPPRVRGYLPLGFLRPKLEIGGHRIFGRPKRRLRKRTQVMVALLRLMISCPIGEGSIFQWIPSMMVKVQLRPSCKNSPVEMEPEELPPKVKEKLPIGRLRYLRPLQPRVNPPWNRLQQSERRRPIGRNAGLRIQSIPRRRMRRQVQPARVSPTLPSTQTMMGICGIPQRPRRELQPRSLEGACAIM